MKNKEKIDDDDEERLVRAVARMVASGSTPAEVEIEFGLDAPALADIQRRANYQFALADIALRSRDPATPFVVDALGALQELLHAPEAAPGLRIRAAAAILRFASTSPRKRTSPGQADLFDDHPTREAKE